MNERKLIQNNTSSIAKHWRIIKMIIFLMKKAHNAHINEEQANIKKNILILKCLYKQTNILFIVLLLISNLSNNLSDQT